MRPVQAPATASLAALLRARHDRARRRIAAIAILFFAGTAAKPPDVPIAAGAPTAAAPAAGAPAAAAPAGDARAPANTASTPAAAAAPAAAATAPAPAGASATVADSMFRHALPEEARIYAGYLRDALRDPDMLALLAASPEARRRLRHLWGMLSGDPAPDCMREPPGRRGPAPADSKPAEPASPQLRQQPQPQTQPRAMRETPAARRPAPALAPQPRPARVEKPRRPLARRLRRASDWQPWEWPPWRSGPNPPKPGSPLRRPSMSISLRIRFDIPSGRGPAAGRPGAAR
jgi:hypothetical protein